ncbi:hypothetical protein [Nonomuraea maritima]|nr:hypothetical protein [Nonomuraea maritima]
MDRRTFLAAATAGSHSNHTGTGATAFARREVTIPASPTTLEASQVG